MQTRYLPTQEIRSVKTEHRIILVIKAKTLPEELLEEDKQSPA